MALLRQRVLMLATLTTSVAFIGVEHMARPANIRLAAHPEDADFDPFQVLSLDAAKLRRCPRDQRSMAVRDAFRAAAFRCHPDTAEDGEGDGAQLQRVKRAAEELRSVTSMEAALKSRLREEVEGWSSDELAQFLRQRQLPDAVVDAFIEEGVEGCDVVGDYRFAGDDVENIIWTLRALGTRNEWEALQVEDAIRILAGVEDGGYSFKRQPGLRVFDRCALYALRAARRAVPSLAV